MKNNHDVGPNYPHFSYYVPMCFRLLLSSIFFLISSLAWSESRGLLSSAPFFFKTKTESMTDKYYFKLDDGNILIRNNDQRSWRSFPGPIEPTNLHSDSLEKIVSISADGENLIAVDRAQRIYYTKIEKIKWLKRWGKPVPKVTKLEENRAWGISHRGPYMAYYDDIDGNRHPILAGVTTLYLLRKNGHEIVYIDPWIPSDWYHQVDMPYRGRFIATNMSVSGSTLFIINDRGEMFTRLYDYDIAGQDPILPYSYKREKRQGDYQNIRSLPAEDWRPQPPIQGMISDKITLLQTGEKGNGAFELRVEGINGQGTTGFYRKRIYEESWQFVATNHQIQGRLIDGNFNNSGRTLNLTPVKTKNYQGKIWLKKQAIPIMISDCSPIISPAKMTMKIDGEEFNFELHMRRYKYKGEKMAFKATIIVPDELINSSSSQAQNIWENLFRKEKYIDFHAAIEGKEFAGIENLHQIGIDKLADLITWKILYPFSKSVLKGKFHRRIRMELKVAE